MSRKIIYDNGLFNVSFSEEAKNYHIHTCENFASKVNQDMDGVGFAAVTVARLATGNICRSYSRQKQRPVMTARVKNAQMLSGKRHLLTVLSPHILKVSRQKPTNRELLA